MCSPSFLYNQTKMRNHEGHEKRRINYTNVNARRFSPFGDNPAKPLKKSPLSSPSYLARFLY